MVRSMRVLLATTVALSLGVVGVVVACPGGHGAGSKAQAKSAKTTFVSAVPKVEVVAVTVPRLAAHRRRPV